MQMVFSPLLFDGVVYSVGLLKIGALKPVIYNLHFLFHVKHIFLRVVLLFSFICVIIEVYKSFALCSADLIAVTSQNNSVFVLICRILLSIFFVLICFCFSIFAFLYVF